MLRRKLMSAPAALALALAAVATPSLAKPVAKIQVRDLFDPNAVTPIHAHQHVRKVDPELEAARDRPARIDVQHYDLAVGVDPLTGAVDGSNKLTFKALSEGLADVVLDATEMQIAAVRGAGGEALTFSYDGTLLTIHLAKALHAFEASELTVQYKALLPQSFYLAKADASSPQRMQAAYTYTEPEGSSQWYPCLDRPSDKATLTLTVSVPQGYNALGNGDLEATYASGDAQVFRYRMERPIATYLVSLNIGKYDVVDLGSVKGKKVTLWTPPAIREAARITTARTPEMIEVYQTFTGVDYPFNSYAQSVAQGYHGSMEHQSATSMGGWRITGDKSGESVVAHELAHQWFGDNVTCRQWGELWLNEGFASYLPYVFFTAKNEPVQALGEQDYWRIGYFAEAKTTAHALSEANPSEGDLFDSHAYEKGALVIHYLRSVAASLPAADAEENFTHALRNYQTDNGGGTATSENLQKALEQATGQSWQSVFDQWVRSAGHPVLSVKPTYVNGALTLTVEQTQHTRTERKWRAFTFPLTVEIVQKDGTVVTHSVDVYDDVHTFSFPLADAPQAVNLDPTWLVPAEITIDQGRDAWAAILKSSPAAQSRLYALRALIAAEDGVASQDTVALIRAESSPYLRVAALEALSEKTENRAAVQAIYDDLLAKESDVDDDTRGALARTESWLVANRGTTPSRDDEHVWQTRYFSTSVVAERRALLDMLKTASLEHAQEFALARVKEPQWVTQDRGALVDLLSKTPTAVSNAFVRSLLADGTVYYQQQVARNLAAAGYDRPEIVPTLIAQAKGHRFYEARPAYVRLLGKQKSSKAQVCPELAALQASSNPDGVPFAAKEAAADLGCGG